jgi:hypothetical protein
VNHASVGAKATPNTAGTASTEPAVITNRGPRASSSRPALMPTMAETTSPAENAALAAEDDQPVSAVIADSATGKA